MNAPNVDAGRLERRVRRMGRETMPGIHGFCSLFPFGAIRGVPLLRLTALVGRETMPGILGFCSLPLFTADCRLRSESALRVTSYELRVGFDTKNGTCIIEILTLSV